MKLFFFYLPILFQVHEECYESDLFYLFPGKQHNNIAV